MRHRLISVTLESILLPLVFLTGVARVSSQSCGPRFSARLLADIPCDMSKTGYCSVPGGAYPWQSVKRYIFDNQGLVRRMYGDERHNSVISKEMADHRMRYNAHFLDSDALVRFGRGRSMKGKPRPSRRQSRPQKFVEEPTEKALTHSNDFTTNPTPTDETIFRVVTETSVKIGDDTTPTLPQQTTTPKMMSLTQMQSSVYEATLNDSTLANTQQEYTTVQRTFTTNQSETTSAFNTNTVTRSESSVESEADDVMSTIHEDKTTLSEGQSPIALQRVSFDDDYEYGEMPKKKFSSVPQNSVEDKIKNKDYEDVVEEDYREKPKDEEDAEDLVMEESERGEDMDEEEGKEETEDSAPRRGINACPVKNEVIAPYWANNTRGETLALLNVYPFEQYVHFEKCAFENHQMLCREGCRCEQQYRLHRLLAFDPRNECRGIFSDWFRFPSCCVCICYDLTPDLPKARTRTARLK